MSLLFLETVIYFIFLTKEHLLWVWKVAKERFLKVIQSQQSFILFTEKCMALKI